jgi:hypothetical protein
MQPSRKIIPGLPLWRSAHITTLDDDERSLNFVASDDSIDRYGDVIETEGWNLEPFRRNPIFLFSHDYGEPLGQVADVRVDGKRLLARVKFAAAGLSERIDEIWRLASAGILRAVSVGFTINSLDDIESILDDHGEWTGGFRFKKPELLELSLVSVPANAHALAITRQLNISAATYARIFQREDTAMEPSTPTPTSPSLPVFSIGKHQRLSQGLPADVATQVERSGRVSYVVNRSVRDLEIVRAALLESGVGGIVPPVQALAPISGYLPFTPMLIDLVPSQPVTAASVIQNRIEYTTPDGNKAAVVPEGTAKPESQLVAASTTLNMETWAHWIQVSTQALADTASLQALIDQILTQGLREKISAGIFGRFTTAGNFTPFAGAVAGESVGDGIARAVAQLATVGGQGIVAAVNPNDLLTQQLAKATGSGVYLGLPPGLTAQVVPSAQVPAGNVLAWASGFGFWANREEITVMLGMIDKQFIQNLRTILAETRGNLVINMPRLVTYGPVTTVV